MMIYLRCSVAGLGSISALLFWDDYCNSTNISKVWLTFPENNSFKNITVGNEFYPVGNEFYQSTVFISHYHIRQSLSRRCLSRVGTCLGEIRWLWFSSTKHLRDGLNLLMKTELRIFRAIRVEMNWFPFWLLPKTLAWNFGEECGTYIFDALTRNNKVKYLSVVHEIRRSRREDNLMAEQWIRGPASHRLCLTQSTRVRRRKPSQWENSWKDSEWVRERERERERERREAHQTHIV